jgi:hypothetical protein
MEGYAKRSGTRAGLAPWLWAFCLVTLCITPHKAGGPDACLRAAALILFVPFRSRPILCRDSRGTKTSKVTTLPPTSKHMEFKEILVSEKALISKRTAAGCRAGTAV